MLAYIHIPYCDSKCHYCAFNSYVGRFDTRPDYMKALRRQLAYELERFNTTDGSIKTLFIGGGTPSTISPDLYAPIFELLDPYLTENAEITTEANPNSATRAWLSGMRDLGINRISFGVQSFDQGKLQTLGRTHTSNQAIDALLEAHAIGIPHLSLDLIYNVHGDTKELISSDIDQALALPVDHLSAYELTIEAHTPFAQKPQMRQENDDLAFFVAKEIINRGFGHYEISNFGRYRSRHNLGYWELKDYIGAGAGAVGFRGLTSDDMSRSDLSSVGLTTLAETAVRYYPPADIDAYIHDPLSITEEPLTTDNLITEQIFLGLRSIVGIDANSLSKDIRSRADLLASEGKLIYKADRYSNPNFFLADELALFLLG